MLFSSIQFICMFFPAFFLCYYVAMFFERAVASRSSELSIKPTTAGRNFVLLVFSLFFYAMGQPENLLLIGFSIIINYVAALLIESFYNRRRVLAGFVMAADIIINFGLLGYYKYSGFLLSTIRSLTGASINIPDIALPIGISFFTFQIVSYVIDVYRRQIYAQKSIFTVAVYLVAFPQLIAGPIVRYCDIEKQLECRHETLAGVSSGLCRFIVGLSKKVIIANTVSAVADGILSYSASEVGMLGAWIAAAAYTIQIYYDFSGYSDMAIGMGQMMGFEYLENFNYPYGARSVTDFWRRWHMSLSSFFRDYVYIPLGGNRVSTPHWIINMAVVWTLTGLWHGAAYTFILWGVYYGVLLIAEKKLFPHFSDRHRILSRIYTLLVFTVGWVIFRTPDIGSLKSTLLAMAGAFGISGTGGVGLTVILRRSGFGGLFIIAFLLGILLSVAPRSPYSLRARLLSACKMPVGSIVEGKRKSSLSTIIISRLLCVILLFVCIILLQTGSYNPFLYFQF
ncbi:MAG: MBOAT family O-acyltransferase [Clostridiaceae bacterium]|nr:MBOAT family O-acyltransferase [Clostridiaceae bacterium]